jgi:hypothetical protein
MFMIKVLWRICQVAPFSADRRGLADLGGLLSALGVLIPDLGTLRQTLAGCRALDWTDVQFPRCRSVV